MPRSRIPYSELLIGAAGGAAFVALARRVSCARPTAVDRAAHDIARRRYHRVLEGVMLPIEVIGLPAVYIPVAVLTARRLRRHGRRGGPVIVTAATAGWIAMRGARLRYARKRPPRPLDRGPKAELSFPSGHTTGMTALAVAAGTVLARERAVSEHIARAITIGVPILVAFNRVYVREHWFTDTVGGLLLGTSVACTCLALDRLTGRAR